MALRKISTPFAFTNFLRRTAFHTSNKQHSNFMAFSSLTRDSAISYSPFFDNNSTLKNYEDDGKTEKESSASSLLLFATLTPSISDFVWWIKRTFQPSIIRKRRKTGKCRPKNGICCRLRFHSP